MITLGSSVVIVAIITVTVGCALFIGLTIGIHLMRLVRDRRHTKRLAAAREKAFEILDGEMSFASSPDRVLDEVVVGLIRQVRGSDRDNLTEFLEKHGRLSRARRELRSHSAVKRARAAQLLGLAADSGAADRIGEMLRDRDERVRMVSARALGKVGDAGSAALLLNVYTDATTPIPAGAVEMAVLHLGTAALPALREGLGSAEPRVRRLSADLLGQLGDSRDSRLLADVLVDETDDDVSEHLCRAIGRLGLPDVAPLLMERLALTFPAGVRRAAAQALGFIDDPHAVQCLTEALHDPDLLVAEASAAALAGLDPASLAEIDCCDLSRVLAAAAIFEKNRASAATRLVRR